MDADWPHGHDKVWDSFTQKWWCVCERWTSDSAETYEQHTAANPAQSIGDIGGDY